MGTDVQLLVGTSSSIVRRIAVFGEALDELTASAAAHGLRCRSRPSAHSLCSPPPLRSSGEALDERAPFSRESVLGSLVFFCGGVMDCVVKAHDEGKVKADAFQPFSLLSHPDLVCLSLSPSPS